MVLLAQDQCRPWEPLLWCMLQRPSELVGVAIAAKREHRAFAIDGEAPPSVANGDEAHLWGLGSQAWRNAWGLGGRLRTVDMGVA